jgi:hypothetical protein
MACRQRRVGRAARHRGANAARPSGRAGSTPALSANRLMQLFLDDHHDCSSRRVHQSFDRGDVEAEDDGALCRDCQRARDLERKFAWIGAPHHLHLAELPGSALTAVHFQVQRLARTTFCALPRANEMLCARSSPRVMRASLFALCSYVNS